MADATPIYDLPYQEVDDPPNGASGLQALAEAVEAELARLDALIEALQES